MCRKTYPKHTRTNKQMLSPTCTQTNGYTDSLIHWGHCCHWRIILESVTSLTQVTWLQVSTVHQQAHIHTDSMERPRTTHCIFKYDRQLVNPGALATTFNRSSFRPIGREQRDDMFKKYTKRRRIYLWYLFFWAMFNDVDRSLTFKYENENNSFL